MFDCPVVRYTNHFNHLLGNGQSTSEKAPKEETTKKDKSSNKDEPSNKATQQCLNKATESHSSCLDTARDTNTDTLDNCNGHHSFSIGISLGILKFFNKAFPSLFSISHSYESSPEVECRATAKSALVESKQICKEISDEMKEDCNAS